jgi:hypothetical protein
MAASARGPKGRQTAASPEHVGGLISIKFYPRPMASCYAAASEFAEAVTSRFFEPL